MATSMIPGPLDHVQACATNTHMLLWLEPDPGSLFRRRERCGWWMLIRAEHLYCRPPCELPLSEWEHGPIGGQHFAPRDASVVILTRMVAAELGYPVILTEDDVREGRRYYICRRDK